MNEIVTLLNLTLQLLYVTNCNVLSVVNALCEWNVTKTVFYVHLNVIG